MRRREDRRLQGRWGSHTSQSLLGLHRRNAAFADTLAFLSLACPLRSKHRLCAVQAVMTALAPLFSHTMMGTAPWSLYPTQDLAGAKQLTTMDQQLRLAEHLSSCIMGKARVDASVVWSHVSQHQGILSSILPLAQPVAVHQLVAVLNTQEADWAPISLPWEILGPGPTRSSWSSPSNTCCMPSPRYRPEVGWEGTG